MGFDRLMWIMKRPIIDQYDRQYMRHYPEDSAWERYERLKAIQGLNIAFMEEFERLGIFKALDWLESKLKKRPLVKD